MGTRLKGFCWLILSILDSRLSRNGLFGILVSSQEILNVLIKAQQV